MGEQLRKARAHAKRKLKDVANAMGISAPYLSDLERGNRYWSTELISKFKKAIA